MCRSGLLAIVLLLIGCGSGWPAPVPEPPAPLSDALLERVTPLEGEDDLEPLLALAEGRRVVLIGEPSHGTHEAHLWRATLTRELIRRGGIGFVALEADLAPVRLLDRYVRDLSGAPGSLPEALAGFERWPTWLWRTPVFAEFVEWLRAENLARPVEERVALAGVDPSDPWGTARALLEELEREDSPHLGVAREAINCLLDGPHEPGEYVAGVLDGAPACISRIRDLFPVLVEGGREGKSWMAISVATGLQHLVLLAEPGPRGWNHRAAHMAEDLWLLHHERGAGVFWAHNTHVGDARATAMARYREVSPGQQLRERWGRDEVLLVGFAGLDGEVRAAPEWGARARVVPIPPALEGSLDHLLAGGPPGNFIVAGWDADRPPPELEVERPHRGIGVVYDPSRTPPEELWLPGVAGQRFDAIVFLRHTTALDSLDR